jgi:hypothetical protein
LVLHYLTIVSSDIIASTYFDINKLNSSNYRLQLIPAFTILETVTSRVSQYNQSAQIRG